MVHALTQSHRVLAADGVVADLHPNSAPGRRARRLPVFVMAGGRELPAGILPEPSDFNARYLAADRAVQRVLRRGLFTLRTSDVFPLRYHFRSLAALEETLEKEWVAGMTVGRALRQTLRAMLRARPGARIVIEEPFRLNLLQKR